MDAKTTLDASRRLAQNNVPSSTSTPISGAPKKWTGESMAEWRERGYVPDSDEEEDEGFDGSPEGAWAQKAILGPGQSSQSVVPVPRDDHVNEEIREARDGLEVVPQESPDGLEATLFEHRKKSSSILATEHTEGSKEATELLSLKNHDCLPPSPASAWVEGQSFHEFDLMDMGDPLPSSPVANELQATLNLGLKQVGEVLRDPKSQTRRIPYGSQSSSPLSSLGFLENELGKDDKSDEPHATSPHAQAIEPPPGPSPQPLPELLAPQRALRQRTQIQLHPYALEDARYQQELKARGLKPVRIAAIQSQQPRNPLQPAEDGESLFLSSPVYEDSGPVSAPGGTQDEMSFDLGIVQNESLKHPDSLPKLGDDEEDLPDLATIFRDGTTGSRTAKPKRYRAAETASSRSTKRPQYVDVFDIPADEETTHHTSSEAATFFVPPSPPRSGSVSASDMTNDKQNKKHQHNPTPKPLPTPLVSSEAHPRKRSVVELSDSSEDLSDRISGSDSVSSSEDDGGRFSRIKAMKRRMRGVLPASWLKLDLKKQTGREEYRRDLQAIHDTVDGKGVAKPVSALRPQTGVAVPSYISRRAAPQIDFSDEDLSADEGMGLDRVEYRTTDQSVLDYGSIDVLEDNRIDTMQPARKRRPNSSSKARRKRQQRLSDAWQNVRQQPGQHISFGKGHSTSKRRPHKALTTKKQRNHKPAPRLTVLDAPSFVQLPIAEQPRFLKVAARRAQQETRETTQSSRGKFLRLATERDTGDVNQSLRHWQDGHIQPRHTRQVNAVKIGPATDRSSLPPETTSILETNNLESPPRTASSLSSAVGALKNFTDITVQRILFKQQGLPSQPSREATFVASTTHISASLAKLRVGINLRKPIPNRSGLGSLQATATHTRFAQLEHTVPDRPSTNLSRSAPAAKNTNHQHIKQASTFQPRPSVIEADDQLATNNPLPAQQPSGPPTVHRIRKSKAPQRTQSGISKGAHHTKSSAAFSVVQRSDKTSDELNVVTDIMAEIGQPNSGGVVKDGWSILWPPLQKWLEVYSDKPSIRTPSEKQQAREIFHLCRELVSKCGWPTAWDDLIRKAAWFFSAFDMVDPFDDKTNPHIGLPPFLDVMDSMVGLALPDAGNSTFYIFLDMLAMSLTRKSIEATDTSNGLAINKRKKTELHSFVNRLYPNNGRLLSEHEEIRKIHLASLWNRCSLYLTLYCYTTEDCRPRLTHFQNLVDFKKSHIKACEAILAVWGVLACFHIKTPETSQYDQLTEMAAWMQSMILAMVLKWVEARQEVANELQIESPTGRIEGPYLHINQSAMRILHANQSSVEEFVRGALATWTMALEKCECQSTAVQLINIGQLDIVLDNLTTFFDKNDAIFQLTLGVIDQYLHKYSTADITPGSPAHRVVLFISHTIDKTLSRRLDTESNCRERSLERVINRRLTYDWSLVASALIIAKQKSWDDFLEPAGRLSWERFKDTKRSAQYQTLFISHIIKAKEEVYRDNKFWYLSYWLRALLRPSHEFLFEHELSNALLKADQYEPILMNLPFLLQSGSAGYDMSLADLKYNRTSVLGTIIEGIATASTSYNSQTVDPYALQPPEMADLLRVVMNTMRLTLSSLDHGSKERDEYELMVCKVAEKMERYTNKIAPLERWLTDADATAFSLYNLRKRFGGPAPATGTILVPKQEIFWFQHTCQKAAVQGTAHEISDALRNVYVDASDISEIEWYQPKMLAMMEQVFPAYLELALTDRGALMGAPLLQVLDSICENVFMRALSIGSEDYSQLLDALYATIISARIAMQRSNMDRDVATIMTFDMFTDEDRSSLVPEPARTRVLAFASVVRIARIAVSQFREVVRYSRLPEAELERINPHAHYIYVFVHALYYCVQDGERDHWSELIEAEWHHLADAEADKVKQFTAEVLERELRLDWTADPAGTWWVMQGRAAVSVKREETETDGLMDPKLRTYVKDQMEDYMVLFEGTTRRTVFGAD